MKDTPGWASPGSAPSDGQEPGAQPSAGSAEPAGRPEQSPSGADARWSPAQPPPGQWSAPAPSQQPGQAPPPPPPGPGWGAPAPTGGPGPAGHRAWGAGWGGPPPAVKPGVIPLRPLGVGEILDGAVSTMRTYWRTVLGISLTVAVVTEVAVVLLRGLVLNDTVSSDALNNPDATVDELARAMGSAVIDSGVVFLVSLVGTVVATALLTTVTSRAVLGRSVTVREAWQDARPQLPRLFGLIFLLLLIAAATGAVGMGPGLVMAATGNAEAGAALAALGGVAAVPVVLWLMIRFSLASPALMLEKQSIRRAMSRSAKLVRGSWWRVFGIQLLAMIIANIVAAIVVVPFSLLGAAFNDDGVSGLVDGTGGVGWLFLVVSGIGSVIGSMITFPISAGVTVLLYIDQRIRREALDLELARAAGLPGHGPGNATPGS
ncbi:MULTISPECIES: glycerophosphoryl diester phosphodiesterase membrane domain-containing protein [unclassified Streptomyces]|uniref:glycerophosphoryl diester phosphodiesterase membrane domain-containing protein n=1 Tax=unclassified Streptomyces TaxID=2593676 RepID=UPI001F03A4F4|nr:MULTISPECIES: glycerophosphoryl diester phosphodiesterase membrane domain-containing protein [unclassified Streptomyces]MCH0566920.1 glycerophosphoryl diester phosphodiesterase membrane domain-containing protein [Streptomyces sp. MUM 2J]MCH0572522.1 glycerophosphoryl diester phosphodiesterase membrane domain-containing protein [Streptomyces sp. MUM 136J]